MITGRQNSLFSPLQKFFSLLLIAIFTIQTITAEAQMMGMMPMPAPIMAPVPMAIPNESRSYAVHNNLTNTTEAIDRDNKILTRTVDVPDSDSDGVSVTTNGLLTSVTSQTGVTTGYDYDALERQTGITDPRTGTSITSYDPATGQVDYVEDADGNRVSFTYDAVTGEKTVETNALLKETRFDYNDRGQVTHTWGDVPYPVRYVYDSYGQLHQMHT